MQQGDRTNPSSAPVIDRVEITTDTLTGRAGLVLFGRYVRSIGIAADLNRLFGALRKSAKGLTVVEIFVQLLCFFVDGTSHHLSRLDDLARDEGYAAAIETQSERMASSHVVKRFFGAFSWYRMWLFRRLLQQLFLWRLGIRKPSVIELGIDTMVMDNNDAQQRHGVQPTYKPVKGFQPLHLTWDRFIIDAVFRGGKKHSNHGDTVEKMIRHVVGLIRRCYDPEAPIILRSDAGFFDEKLFRVFEELQIGYICSGKLYKDIRAFVQAHRKAYPPARYQKGRQVWAYVEFADRRGTWKSFRRAFYCWPLRDGQQLLLPLGMKDFLFYTNLGMGGMIDERLGGLDLGHWLEAPSIIESIHGRGRDELVHRALKDFGPQALPFKRFAPNGAYYYTMLVSFFLYEAFKEDVTVGTIQVTAYPTTLRRRVLDVAGKIIRHAGRVILKVTRATWDQLRLDVLWARSGNAPVFAWAT